MSARVADKVAELLTDLWPRFLKALPLFHFLGILELISDGNKRFASFLVLNFVPHLLNCGIFGAHFSINL